MRRSTNVDGKADTFLFRQGSRTSLQCETADSRPTLCSADAPFLQIEQSGVAGVQHRVTATPSDEYGNVIDPSNLPPGQRLAIRVRGFPDPRADVDPELEPFLVDLETEIDGRDLNGNARFVGSFTPIAAGWYVVQSAFVGLGRPSKAFLDFTERVGQPGHLGAQVRVDGVPRV